MASGNNNHNSFAVGIGFHLRCNRQGCYLTNGQQLSMVYTLIDHRSDVKVFKTYHVISVEEGVRGLDHRQTAQNNIRKPQTALKLPQVSKHRKNCLVL